MALGQIGALDVASITVDALSTAIRFASVEHECKSEEARQLLHTAKTVLEVRQALRGQSDESTLAIRRDAVLEDIRTGRIAQGPAHAELKKACDERDNVVMLAALNSAITQGSCAGVPGALILGGVDVLSLQQALATVDRLGGARTDAARHLRRCADTLLELRQAVLASQEAGESDGESDCESEELAHFASWCLKVDLRCFTTILLQSDLEKLKFLY